MQRPVPRLPGTSAPTFSILGRIGGDATRGEGPGTLSSCSCFQYPRSDRRRCNQTARFHHPLHKQTFSILGRIGGDATVLRVSGWLCRLSVFQYPRSDRRRCNVRRRHCDQLSLRPFSILGRIGGDATCGLLVSKERGTRLLSVSSVGSEAMQRASRWERWTGTSCFQYPRSDRRRCNYTPWKSQSRTFFVTFSILGRIGGDATRHTVSFVF